MHLDTLKSQTEATVSEHAHALTELSETLHANPETAWEEYASAEAVAHLLEHQGFTVTRNYLGFDTAFLAEAGSGSRKVGFMAEYDALPGLGHACGHNLIAASSVGAGLALAPLADQLDAPTITARYKDPRCSNRWRFGSQCYPRQDRGTVVHPGNHT